MNAAPAAAVRGRRGPAAGPTVVVWGLLASYPFGGMTWQVLHHLEGLRRLGVDVWYVEDRDDAMLHAETFDRTLDLEANLTFLRRQLEPLGFGERWVVRPSSRDETTFGALDAAGLRELYRDADAALNLCGAQHLRPEHLACRRLVYIETDPVANQVAVARGDAVRIAALDAYHHHFTYGTNLYGTDCRVPVERYRWIPTVPPVVPDWWRPTRPLGEEPALTTVANWNTEGKVVEWCGERWSWNKHDNFVRFLDAPAHLRHPLEIAAVRVGDDAELLRAHGWRLVSAWRLTDPARYRDYLCSSYAEFSVAKEQYVAPRSGWFSDRSVCYLAAGRPVLVQDTGFARAGPDHGILTFNTERELAERARDLEADYGRHAEGATRWAEDVFDAERVLGEMMERIGLA